MTGTTKAVIVEQTYCAPLNEVWKAITDPGQMRQWFFEPIPDFKPQAGFQTRFNVRCEDKDYLHVWQVTNVVPEKLIAYSWRYEGYPGDSTVTWELSACPPGTMLRFSHDGIESFPRDDPVFSRESTQAGWDYFVRDRLKSFLEPAAGK